MSGIFQVYKALTSSTDSQCKRSNRFSDYNVIKDLNFIIELKCVTDYAVFQVNLIQVIKVKYIPVL